jgi:hypothetical protein
MMIAAIDLDEFTEARAAHPRLMNLRRTKLAWNPQADGDLEPPHDLLGQPFDSPKRTFELSQKRTSELGLLQHNFAF